MGIKKIMTGICALSCLTLVQAHAETTLLNASGKGDTYMHIRNILGANSLNDVADSCSNEIPEIEHVKEVFDQDLGKTVFEITSHANDIDCVSNKENRARTEIKVDGLSAEHLKVTKENEHTTWHFLIKIDADFQSTDSFTHFIQAKGEIDKNPRFRLSLYNRSSGENLELNYSGDKGEFKKLVSIPINDKPELKGQWIEVIFDVVWANQGQLKFSLVNHSTGEVIHSYDQPLDLWNEDWEYIRPKFGIYRERINDPMTDGSVRFSDIKFTKGEDIGYIKKDFSLHLPSLNFNGQELWAELKFNGDTASKIIEWVLDSFGSSSIQNNTTISSEVEANFNISIPVITDGQINYSAVFKFSGKRDEKLYWELESYDVVD